MNTAKLCRNASIASTNRAQTVYNLYISMLSTLSNSMYVDIETPEIALLADLIRTQFTLARITNTGFKKLLRQQSLVLKYNLFINDKRAFRTTDIVKLIIAFPILCNFDATIDASKALCSVLVEIVARNIKLHKDCKRRPASFIEQTILAKQNIAYNVYLIAQIAYIFDDPQKQVTAMQDIKSFIDSIIDANLKTAKNEPQTKPLSKPVPVPVPVPETEHETEIVGGAGFLFRKKKFVFPSADAYLKDDPEIWGKECHEKRQKKDKLSDASVNIFRVLALEFNMWDKFCPNYGNTELSEWERSSEISVKQLVNDAYKRHNRHKYHLPLKTLQHPKLHNHSLTTMVLFTTPTDQTKRFPIFRCSGCSTYGSMFLRHKQFANYDIMKNFIKDCNVFLSTEFGPVYIKDFIGTVRYQLPVREIKFTDTKLANTLDQLRINQKNQKAKEITKLVKIERYNRRERDPSKRKPVPELTKFEDYYKYTAFEKCVFNKILVASLTDNTEHQVGINQLKCGHHHHCRTKPTHHKPIIWSKTDGVTNFKLFSLLPHTRLALAIQALYRMRTIRKAYKLKRFTQSFAQSFTDKLFTETIAKVST